MRLLLDTHALLWWLLDDPALPPSARKAIEQSSAVFVSAASIWEIAIKQRLGKLPDLGIAAAELPALIDSSGLLQLPVGMHHAAAVASLPIHHRDPFDHLLIAQAGLEGLSLLSRDAVLSSYGVEVVW